MEPTVKRIGDVTIERVITEKKPPPKDEDPSLMNYGTESESDLGLSEEDIAGYEERLDESLDKPTTSSYEPPLLDPGPSPSIFPTSKRKNDFEDIELAQSTSKKCKNDGEGNIEEFEDQNHLQSSELEDDEEDEFMESLVRDKGIIGEIDDQLMRDTVGENSGTASQRARLHSENEDSEYDSEEDSEGEDPIRKLPSSVSVIDTDKTDFIEKLASELGEPSCSKSEEDKISTEDYNYDITEKLKEMGEISVETVKKGDKSRKPDASDIDNEISVTPAKKDDSDSDDKNNSERKIGNMRRNIREVMDETQLDEATLAAQRQEMERLRRVQEQQRIIREVQRQIALNRQNNKTQHRVISLLQGNSSLIKHIPGSSTAGSASTSAASCFSGNSSVSIGSGSGVTPNRIGGTVLVKLPNGETKPMTRITKGGTPFDLVRIQKGAMQSKMQRNLIPLKKASGGNLTPSVSIAPVIKKMDIKTEGTDSESDMSDSEKKIRKVAGKPKDVVTISSSSDDDCIVLSEEEPDEPEPEEDPCNSGMHTNDSYNVPDEQGRVLINVGHPENEADVFLAPQIARVIKPHQIGGVRFLFDNVIESVDRFSTSTGFGCILAHSMGLGKTLQIVCFSDIFLRNTEAKTILCIMPINTLQNWMAEYNMWLPKDPTNSPLLSHGEVRPRDFNIYVLNDSHKTLAARAKVIQAWSKEGGVLLIGYELYRLLSLRRNPKAKAKRKKGGAAAAAAAAAQIDAPDPPEEEEKNKSMFEEIHEALVKPGPDLVICDEGHRIKNSHASISQALKQIRSKRRIVLTGYPLQNNLLEYWCMVDFVRPNYLGTKTEFSNMFERPIQNGQCIDSTPQDIRLMRYRAHVLHSLLEGFVQRRSHAVLQTSLPQKEEYVLLVRMTEFQRKLYDTFMNEVVRTKTVPNPLKAFAVCCKIWNHPDVLYYFLKKHTSGEAVDLDLLEVAGSTTSGSAPSTPATPKKPSRAKAAPKKEKKIPTNDPTVPATPKKASRAKGGVKKERKTAATKKAEKAAAKTGKPAASVTPHTNTTTTPTQSTASPSTTTPSPATTPLTPASSAVIPIPLPSSGAPPMPPPTQNPPGYTDMNPNYPPAPGSYPAPHTPYQNYPQYPQNGDYFNQNQNYPNNYNPGYYPNQEYGGNFYSEGGNGNSMQPYQQDNQQQAYWNPPGNNPQQPNQQQYYHQNGPQGEYYGNMNQQQPGYGNQDYYRYNQNYPPNNMYQPNANPYQQQNNQNWPQQPANSNPQQQDAKPNFNQDFKPDFGSEFKQEYNPAIKQETKDEPLKTGEPILDLDAIKMEAKMKMEGTDEDKKEGEAGISKDDLDEKDPDKNALSKVNIKEDPGIPYDWAQELMKGYVPGEIENSAKMEIFFCILTESMALGDRILLFSQSLFTLNLIEEFLQKRDLPGTEDNKWAKNKHYYRLDGSTSALEREKLINEYNSNPNIHLFLVSTRAGSLGINLVGANRVIVFDASWNPCHDTQAVCRVYRYGQKKPCFVYRIVMDNCLEKKIYDRQINKQGMADRVVDECNPDAHLSMKDVTNLCWDDEKESEVKDFSTTKDKYIDVVMQKVLDAYSHRLCKEPFQHESLLIDRKEKKLSQAEKRLAKRSYELEKQANINSRPTYSYYNSGSGQGLQIRAIRNQDGILQNKPIASVRPMQSEQMVRDMGRPGGAAGQGGRSRWIPAEVWQRQGMTAQEMTLPLDVVIPTNSPDRGSIVLKAGQKVLVLKSPKGIYMQLECGKIVAIKTAFKVRGGKAPEKGEEGANKDGAPPPTTIVKKVPSGANTSKNVSNVPLPLKNNTAITVIPKGQQRLVKPFAQGMTKLNMRSIRQPVPNLIGRQMRMGGPRFTGKIQSIHRKVQLAKAKPYNLEKPGGSPSPSQINPIQIDPTKIKNEPSDREVPEMLDRHNIVPSSDEEIPIDPQNMIPNPDGEKKDEEESMEDPEQFHPHEMYSEGEKSSDIERLSNTDYSENNLDSNRRPSSESCYQSPEKMSSSDSFTNLDQFSNEFATGQETYPSQNTQFIRSNSDQFGGNQDFQQQSLPLNTGKFRNNPDFESYGIPPTPPQIRIPPNVPPHMGGTNNPNIPPHNVSGALEMFPVMDNRKSIQQDSPVIINKFINPTERFHPSMDYPKPGKAEIISVTIPDKPIVIPPPSDKQKSYPTSTITNQPLTIPSPVVSHEQASTKRSLKNYRHNFAGQKAHLNPNQNPNLSPNVTIKPLPGKKTATSSALHQLEQTTSAIGEVKQAFQETLDSITNSYGSGLPDQQKLNEENSSVIDLDVVEKAEPEKTAKNSTSKQTLIHPPIQLDPIKPPPLHRLTPPSSMTIKQPEIHLPVHHPPTSQHLQSNPPTQVHHSPAPGLPTPPQQQPHPASPQQTQIPMQHPPHQQLPQHQLPQHQPPHGHQQDYGAPYVGYYGYGGPPVQPYPPPPHQPYYNPPDPAVHYQEIKPKNPTEKPGPNIVSQASSNIQRSEPIQSTPPSAPSSLSSLPTPAPITTPHHTPTPSGTPTSYNPISSANAVCTTPTPPNVTTAQSPAIPQNPAPISHPPVSGAPPTAGVPPGPPTGGFAPYGQPGMPPPPPHGTYDMMGYPQQNQYSGAYPGMPYPNQPNYQPPYQPPAGQYEQPGAGTATYPPGPAPPNMYSAFHRPDVHHPQYGADPYAQPHYAATVRNAYPPQYGYPPPPAAQAPYGGAPAPGPAPGYDYQYNANGFPPPPPPFVNPYPGLPNNNPQP